MPSPASAGKDPPLSEDNNDLFILSVRESTSGHEKKQTPVATEFQAYLFKSKFDSLTNSMLKMSDSLARFTQPHGAPLNSEEEDALLEKGGQSESDSTERILWEEAQIDHDLGELPHEDLFKTRRTMDRR